jgi:hypothetical protein
MMCPISQKAIPWYVLKLRRKRKAKKKKKTCAMVQFIVRIAATSTVARIAYRSPIKTRFIVKSNFSTAGGGQTRAEWFRTTV